MRSVATKALWAKRGEAAGSFLYSVLHHFMFWRWSIFDDIDDIWDIALMFLLLIPISLIAGLGIMVYSISVGNNPVTTELIQLRSSENACVAGLIKKKLPQKDTPLTNSELDGMIEDCDQAVILTKQLKVLK